MDYWVKEFERRWLEETVPARMGITGQGLVFMDQEARGFDGPAKIHWELGEDGWAGTLSGDQLPSVLVSGVNAPGDAARAGAAVLAIDRLSKE